MNKTDLAYLAGFFDGEGSIFIDKNFGMACAMTSTTKWALESLRFSFGGNITKNKKIYNPSQHTTFQWKINSTIAKTFLQAISPYLKLKKPEAEVAIKFQIRKDKIRRINQTRLLSRNERVLREADRILLQKMKEQVKGSTETLEVGQTEEPVDNQLSLL